MILYTTPNYLHVSDDEDTLPIQSHANIDLVTFDSLNSHNIQKLVQERDRLEFGNMRQRHTLMSTLGVISYEVI